MSEQDPVIIKDLADFLAHARILEREAIDRYRELADCMEVHNNPDVAALFLKLAELGEEHANRIQRRAASLELPRISPWEFKWICPEGPESTCMEEAHYLMDIRQALRLALLNEERARDFYLSVTRSSPSTEVSTMAAEFASEETEHVSVLMHWLADLAGSEEAIPEDLDPPNIPG